MQNNTKTVAITADGLQLYTHVKADSSESFAAQASVMLSRLQALLCDNTLTLEAMPEPLALVLYTMIAWGLKETPIDDAVKSETAENYSYTLNDSRAVSTIDRIRARFGDILASYSKCEGVGGEVKNAQHIPLYTPDYYRDEFGGLD